MRLVARLMTVLGAAVAVMITSCAAADNYSRSLSPECTKELEAKSGEIKIVLVIDNDGTIRDFAPYGQKLMPVSFPLKVSDIAGPTNAITLTPYHASPVRTLVCWPSMGQWICK